ncbi:restriction endonuclease subunit S [Enterococcus faecalis]|uniref:restriction endonuclease subunit S n=1 Tax=Enterococcus faecalis TaxID=1351 RepID=UPI0035D85A3C
MMNSDFMDTLLDGVEVEWKTLDEIGLISSAGVDKKKIEGEKSIKLLNYMDVYRNMYLIKDIPSMIVTAPDKKIEQCNVLKGDIFFTPSSEVLNDIGNSAVALENMYGVVYSYHIMRLRLNNPNIITSMFINYMLGSEFVQNQINKNAKGLTRFGLTKTQWEKLQIPIPPLNVQEEIVRILDTFTELTAELTARKMQYTYYLNKLLTFEDGEAEWKTLGELGPVRMCKRILKEQTLDTGDIPFYKIGTFGKDPNAYISRKLFDEYRSKYNYPKIGEVLLSASGTIGRAVIFDGKDAYFQDSNIVWIENDETQVLNKYLFYFYKVAKWDIAEGGTIQRLYNENLKKTKILIPFPDYPEKSLAEQERIVSILDKFDALTTSITEGLPREIELRQKQYEYYRNMLLSFPKEEV